MIKKIYLISAFIITLVFIASSAYCTEWLYFIESGEGDKHYIDLDSIKRSPEGIVSVKRKIISRDSSTLDYAISEFEMDCEKVKIRKMSEKAYEQDRLTASTMSKSKWQAINPEGIDESLYELACSLKKKSNQQ
jgi:hypothetical protein